MIIKRLLIIVLGLLLLGFYSCSTMPSVEMPEKVTQEEFSVLKNRVEALEGQKKPLTKGEIKELIDSKVNQWFTERPRFFPYRNMLMADLKDLAVGHSVVRQAKVVSGELTGSGYEEMLLVKEFLNALSPGLGEKLSLNSEAQAVIKTSIGDINTGKVRRNGPSEYYTKLTLGAGDASSDIFKLLVEKGLFEVIVKKNANLRNEDDKRVAILRKGTKVFILGHKLDSDKYKNRYPVRVTTGKYAGKAGTLWKDTLDIK